MQMDDHVKKLIAIGASIGANCQTCLEYHIGKALESGIDKSEITAAVEIAKSVRRGAAITMDKLALCLLNDEASRASCGSGESNCCCSE
jgi:AhpD family alkylhydroperoxidase